MKLELSTEEIRAILTAHLRAQGLPIEPDAKVEFVASDWGGDDELKVEILTASFDIVDTTQDLTNGAAVLASRSQT